jgi:hypothetical protein
MATYTVDNTKVGTSLVAAAGTMTALTVAVAPTITDKDAQVRITDGPGGRNLFAATISALVFLFEPRPGVALTPGTTAPTFPRSVWPVSGSQAFANGLYVQSCPTGISLTVTA